MEQNEIGLYDIYDMPYKPPSWGWVSVLSIITVFLIAICVFIYFRRKKDLQLSPTEKALYEIQKLSSQSFVSEEDKKQFYLHLTFILKQFLRNQYKLDVMPLTDTELILFLKNDERFKSMIEDLTLITSGLSQVKFAGQAAAQEKMQKDLTVLRDIIFNLQVNPK